MKNIPARDQIEPGYTWNRESMYLSSEEWEQAFERSQVEIEELPAEQDGFVSSAGNLRKTLDRIFELSNRVEHVMLYAALEYSVDTTNDEAASRNSRARTLLADLRSAISFLEPGILELGLPTVQAWVEQDSDLSIYDHFITDLFRKAETIRSAEVETLMGSVQDPFSGISSTVSMLTNADMDFGYAVDTEGAEHQITQGSYATLVTRPDRKLRQTTWERYHDRYREHKNTLASALETSTKQAIFIARTRGYDSTLQAALHPYNIPAEVFHNLLAAFEEHLPVWHRYFALRKRLLGLEQLEAFDVWAPLTQEPPNIPFEQAIDWICAGLAPLGEEYVEILRHGVLHERWVDVFPNRGKRQGAFSWGAPGTHPFIVMNYDNTIFRLSTLAHELGHSMHSYLAWKTQPLVYADYSLFVAEVASNMHQALVRAYLLETQDDPGFQIAIIEEAMSNFHRYLLQMPSLARFEWEMHQDVSAGHGLTSSRLSERMTDLLQEAYGDAMGIDRARAGMTWATFGHLYVYFYVFQYATGIAAAQALASRLLSGEPGAQEAYLEFLRCGGSKYPLDALDLAGIDLRTPDAIVEAFKILEGMIDRLESLTKSASAG